MEQIEYKFGRVPLINILQIPFYNFHTDISGPHRERLPGDELMRADTNKHANTIHTDICRVDTDEMSQDDRQVCNEKFV